MQTIKRGESPPLSIALSREEITLLIYGLRDAPITESSCHVLERLYFACQASLDAERKAVIQTVRSNVVPLVRLWRKHHAK